MNTSCLTRKISIVIGLLVIAKSPFMYLIIAEPQIDHKVGASDIEPWYKRFLVGMEVGPTGAQFGHSDINDVRYCAKFDGRQIVRYCVSANCDYLVIWVRDGDYAYYDSKLLPKAPGLGKRDALRETMAEAQKHNLPVIAYCVVQQGGHFLDKHPEYEMRDYQGNSIGRFCYHSGYLDVMKEIVAEQLAYGINGFHIDMLDQGFGPPYGCWCVHCQQKFESQYGRAMPKGVTWDEDWDRMFEFRYATSQRFEKALYNHIKKLNPKATVDYNYHGNPPFSWEVGQRPVQHADNSDFVTGETGVWGFSALTVGLNAEFYRASTPGLPYQVAMQRGVRKIPKAKFNVGLVNTLIIVEEHFADLLSIFGHQVLGHQFYQHTNCTFEYCQGILVLIYCFLEFSQKPMLATFGECLLGFGNFFGIRLGGNGRFIRLNRQ